LPKYSASKLNVSFVAKDFSNWLAICDADPFFFRFVAALLSDISQAKKAQERQADMQVDVVPHEKLPRKTDASMQRVQEHVMY